MQGPGVVEATFLGYRNNYHKSVISRYSNGGNSGGYEAGGLWASQWNGGPITNIMVKSDSSPFSANVVFSIYGIEG